jgi:transposase-like protein
MARVQFLCSPILGATGRVEDSAVARFLSLEELFEGHFDREIIVLCVRWYLRFKLSFRDLVEMMAERGLSMAHTTVMRWVHHDAPAGWNIVACRRNLREGPWRMGVSRRTVDRVGHTVDFHLSSRRNVAGAKAFFRNAIKSRGSSPRRRTARCTR